jgi:hypothetical protein
LRFAWFAVLSFFSDITDSTFTLTIFNINADSTLRLSLIAVVGFGFRCRNQNDY